MQALMPFMYLTVIHACDLLLSNQLTPRHARASGSSVQSQRPAWGKYANTTVTQVVQGEFVTGSPQGSMLA